MSVHITISHKCLYISQFLETLMMTVHYILISNNNLTNISFLLQEYFISIQYSCVFYYFISQLCEAFKILRILPKIKLPLIFLNALGILGFSIFVIIKSTNKESLYNCNNMLWVYLHAFNLGLSMIFIVVGLKANKLLKTLISQKGIIVDDIRIKQFWSLICFMFISSIVNVAESIWYIDMSNSDCYNSYVSNEDLDLFIFCMIRFTSHYLFIIVCLVVFRMERISVQSILASESDHGESMTSYISEDFYSKNQKDQRNHSQAY